MVLPNLSNLVGQVGNIVTSTLWKLKMRTYFNRFDFNKDGVIRRSDFQTIAKNFAAKEGFSPEDTDAAVNGFNDVSTCFILMSYVLHRFLMPYIDIVLHGLCEQHIIMFTVFPQMSLLRG